MAKIPNDISWIRADLLDEKPGEADRMALDKEDFLRSDAFEALLERVAERGAKRALHDVGLHDDAAGDDVRELRGLLESFRGAKATVGKTLVQFMTTAFIGALIAGAWVQWGDKK